MSMKKSNDTIGNRTRDLRLVAQCLKHLRHRRFTIYREFILIFKWEIPPCGGRVACGRKDRHGEGNSGFSHLLVKVPKTGFTK